VINTYEIDPLQDARWHKLLAQHRHSTVFHTPAWLSALKQTYGYAVSALTTSAPGEDLKNAVVFCRVQSWLTGRRVVSVPFADHCTPLVNRAEEFECLLSTLQRECEGRKRSYIEIRSVSDRRERARGFSESGRFHLHRLDLRPSLDELFHGLHPSCIRRRLARALKERFVYEEGRSEDLLQKFYQLAILTRRRQYLPPQPLAWFRNLIRSLGEQLKLRVISLSGKPAAAILTIEFQRTMTYKYGFSDSTFHPLGSMQLLLWKAIEEAKNAELSEFDMGRTDWTNEGLATFKDRWGCRRFHITHLRYPAITTRLERASLRTRLAKPLFAWAPDTILTVAGNLLYRHMA
jgi:GNAT acetyltransferase-like protein